MISLCIIIFMELLLIIATMDHSWFGGVKWSGVGQSGYEEPEIKDTLC